MNNTTKKSIVIFISLVFLLSGVTITSADSVSSVDTLSMSETILETRTITVYRCGPDGSISPVKIDISAEDGKGIDDLISEKCDQLFENDAEMQNLVQNANFSFGIVCKVKSRGRGFHYKSMLLEKILLRFALFRLGLPRISTFLRRPLIICKYGKDLNAKTTITPLLNKNATASTVEGNHTVLVQNFIGYTTWIGRFSKSPLDIIPRAFSGIARFAVCI